jgi:RNA polymerase sigma-70 factor, ECF subfamily
MDDLQSINRCRTGDRDAFRYLVEKYQAQAIGNAIAILGNREDALDAVQDAFLDAFRSLNRFDDERRFYPWFYIILRNRCYKLATGRKRSEMSSLDDLEILAPPPNLSLEDALQLELALLKLSSEDREVIALKHLDGLSYEEIAERLEIPQGTVMSRLYYARKRLREAWLAIGSKTGKGREHD